MSYYIDHADTFLHSEFKLSIKRKELQQLTDLGRMSRDRDKGTGYKRTIATRYERPERVTPEPPTAYVIATMRYRNNEIS